MSKLNSDRPDQPSPAVITAIACLKGLSASTLTDIAANSTLQRFEKDATIIQHLAETDEIYFLVDGKVRVNTLAASGRPITYQILESGEHFGEIAAVDQLPRSKSVTADTSVTTVCVRGNDFRSLLETHTDLSNQVIRWLVETTRWYTDKVFEYHTYNVQGRILAELLKLAPEPGAESFSVPITDRDMASRVGTTRENVSRIYAQLRKDGVVDRRQNEVSVLSTPKLRAHLEASEFS